MKSFMQKTETLIGNQQATIRDLQSQISQISQQISSRPAGSLPSKTEENPKGVNAITLRSGKEVEIPNRIVEEKKEIQVKDKGKKKDEEPIQGSQLLRPYVPPIPFLGRLKQQKLDEQFAKFLDVFKNLQINIPFLEAIQEMPSHAKFIKELLSKKRRIDGNEPVILTGECSMILQKNLSN